MASYCIVIYNNNHRLTFWTRLVCSPVWPYFNFLDDDTSLGIMFSKLMPENQNPGSLATYVYQKLKGLQIIVCSGHLRFCPVAKKLMLGSLQEITAKVQTCLPDYMALTMYVSIIIPDLECSTFCAC